MYPGFLWKGKSNLLHQLRSLLSPCNIVIVLRVSLKKVLWFESIFLTSVFFWRCRNFFEVDITFHIYVFYPILEYYSKELKKKKVLNLQKFLIGIVIEKTNFRRLEEQELFPKNNLNLKEFSTILSLKREPNFWNCD